MFDSFKDRTIQPSCMADLVDATDERGMTISPVLPDGCKNFLIDIDGTICEDIPNEEPERMVTAECFEGVVEQINKWFKRVIRFVSLLLGRKSIERLPKNGLQGTVSNGILAYLASQEGATIIG